MDFIKQYQTGIIFLAIVLALFLGYQYFFADETGAVVEVTALNSGADQELVALLFELKGIQLDDSIFTDPVFQSLNDFGRDLVPEPVGRKNPFAPLTGSTPIKPKQAP